MWSPPSPPALLGPLAAGGELAARPALSALAYPTPIGHVAAFPRLGMRDDTSPLIGREDPTAATASDPRDHWEAVRFLRPLQPLTPFLDPPGIPLGFSSPLNFLQILGFLKLETLHPS